MLINSQRHSVHKAFLYFFQGICYESSGIAAHDYSSTKLPLLHDAEGCFALALQVLPQPYVSTEFGQPYTPQDSPEYDVSDILHQYDSSGCSSPDSPCPVCVDEPPVRSDSVSSLYSDLHQPFSPVSDVPNLDDCSSREDADYDLESPPLTPITDGSTQRRLKSKARLSQSLSSQHILAEELIPSPLTRVERSAQTTTSLPAFRPLPPLPFNHKPTFLLRGGRQVLVPARQSAIQTLAAKFESNIPMTPPSPVTPRFDQIRRAFSPISTNQHLDSYLGSTSLTRYNEYLSSFRDQLIRHTKSIREYTDRAIEIQQQHKEKRLSRMASFWSFKPTDQSPESDPMIVARKERIVQLKAKGWVVRKERHGWKGQAYYDRLRQQAEADLY